MASNCCILDSIINWQYSCSEIKSYVIIIISIVAPGSQTFTQSKATINHALTENQSKRKYLEMRSSSVQIKSPEYSYLVAGSDETVGGNPASLLSLSLHLYLFMYVHLYLFMYVHILSRAQVRLWEAPFSLSLSLEQS